MGWEGGALSDEETRYQEGRRLEERGLRDEARKIYESLIGTDLTAEVHNRLGVLEIYDGNTDQAKGHFEKAIEAQDTYAPALSNLGNIYLEMNRVDRAEQLYRQAIESDPDLASPHQNLAVILKRRGDIGGMAGEMKTYQRLRRRSLSGARRSGRPGAGCMPAALGLLVVTTAALWFLHVA